MKKSFWLAVSLFLLSSGWGFSQVGLSVASFTADYDSMDAGAGQIIVSYQVKVVVTGTGDFQGPINVYRKYTTTGEISSWYTQSFWPPLQPDDTLYFSHSEDITNNQPCRYAGGDNLILVWPYSPDASTVDSADWHLFITNFTCVTSTEKPSGPEDRVKVFPNPVQGSLKLTSQGNGHRLEYVSLANMTGQMFFQAEGGVSEVDMSGMPTGVYLLEVRFDDGQVARYRVTKD